MKNLSNPRLKKAIDLFCEKQPLMTSMVYALEVVEANYVPTMGTDGEYLYYNPDFIKTLTDKELAAIVYHEVLHCAFLHMWRRDDREQFKFNIACDFAINPTVNETFPLPKGSLLSRKFFNKSAEEIYDMLPENKGKDGKKGKKDKNSKGQGQSGEGQGTGDSGEDEKKDGNGGGSGKDSKNKKDQQDKDGNGGQGKGEKDKKDNKNKGGLGSQGEEKDEKDQNGEGGSGNDSKKDKQKNKGKGSGSGQDEDRTREDTDKEQDWGDHSMWGKEGKKKREEAEKKRNLVDKATGKNKVPERKKTDKELEDEWKERFEEVIVKNIGSMPGNLRRLVEKIREIPVIDWAALVANILSVDETDYAFAYPDRRFLDGDYMLPGLYSGSKLQDVVFAYDTSGSISEEDLRDFYNETIGLFDNFANIKGWLAVCDTRLHSFIELNTQDEFEDLEFRGGGGTDFRPVFNEVEKRGIRPKALFFFTDTAGSFPSTPPDYPVFWLVKTELGQKNNYWGYYNPSAPFGQIIKFAPIRNRKVQN